LFSLFPVLKLTFQTAWKPQPGKAFLLCLLLFGFVLWVFLPALRGNFIESDDYPYVIGNTHINFTAGNLVWPMALTHGECGNWHPLTHWSLMLDHLFYGLNPWGYHLTNVLLHAINTVLVFLVLRRMTGSTGPSWMVAVFFALHPLRVESVAWISERKDVLSVMFWMLTLWAYTRYVQNVTSGKWPAFADLRRGRQVTGTQKKFPSSCPLLFYGLALVFFTLGLMSKPMVVTLPCVLLLLDFWPLERWKQKSWRGLLLDKLPFFLLSSFVSVVTYFVQRNEGMMNYLVGLSFGARLENALVSYGRYLGKLFWPVDLCALYPHPRHWPLAAVLPAGLLVFGLSVLVFARRRERPYLLTGWFWYLGTLVPVIGLVQAGLQSMADRYSYIPSVGILIVLVWEFHRLTGGWRCRNIVRGATGGVLVLFCVLLTRHQMIFWRDGVSLWGHAVSLTENNYDCLNNLGRAFYAQGRFDEAIRELQEVVRLNPSFAEAYCSLGQAFAAQGRIDGAIAACQKALEVSPRYVPAHNDLSDFLLRKGRRDEAMAHCLQAVEIAPDSATSQNNLGNALALEGRFVEALAHLQKALALQPDNHLVHLIQANLGSVLFRMGQLDEAIPYFRMSLKSEPNNAKTHNDLGGVLLTKGQVAEAIYEFQQAVQLQPEQFEIRRNLGHALMQQGHLDEAIREFQAALNLKPDNVVASNDLVTALARKEKPAAQPPPTKP
jgi:tetratricopeptide (TPR) repeat protein